MRVKFSLICVHFILIYLLCILLLSYLFEILAFTSKSTCGCTSITNSICNFRTLSFRPCLSAFFSSMEHWVSFLNLEPYLFSAGFSVFISPFYVVELNLLSSVVAQ
jgi:hypothetical protein